jgi:hypothetical protein
MNENSIHKCYFFAVLGAASVINCPRRQKNLAMLLVVCGNYVINTILEMHASVM